MAADFGAMQRRVFPSRFIQSQRDTTSRGAGIGPSCSLVMATLCGVGNVRNSEYEGPGRGPTRGLGLASGDCGRQRQRGSRSSKGSMDSPRQRGRGCVYAQITRQRRCGGLVS